MNPLHSDQSIANLMFITLNSEESALLHALTSIYVADLSRFYSGVNYFSSQFLVFQCPCDSIKTDRSTESTVCFK